MLLLGWHGSLSRLVLVLMGGLLRCVHTTMIDFNNGRKVFMVEVVG